MSELKAGAEGRSERARAGLQPSPRRQHRRRLPASGPRHFGGFGARGPRQGPHGGSAAGGPGRAAGPRAGSGRHSAEPHQRQSLHLVSAGPPRGAAGAGRDGQARLARVCRCREAEGAARWTLGAPRARRGCCASPGFGKRSEPFPRPCVPWDLEWVGNARCWSCEAGPCGFLEAVGGGETDAVTEGCPPWNVSS